MSHADLLVMGRVGRPHGVHGELKIFPETDDPHRFEKIDQVYLGLTASDTTPFAIEGVRYQTNKKGLVVLLKLVSITSRESADRLKQLTVFARESDLPPLDDDEYFIHDLIGLHVVDLEASPLGQVKDVLDLPAHRVYLIARDSGEEVMVPAVPAFIEAIDFSTRQITLRDCEMFFE